MGGRGRGAAVECTAVIAACVAIPLLLALAWRWLPHHPAIMPACAGVTLAACLSLPWTGAALGGWLVPDPVGITVAALASLGWLAATLLAPVDLIASVVAGCLNLALLTGRPDLTVVAAGAAAIVAGGRGLLPATASGLGLAVFGMALLQGMAPGDWTTLPEAGRQVGGPALGVAMVLVLLGLGAACLLPSLMAAVRGVGVAPGMGILAGPLGGVWLVVALRLRGVLDGNSHAVAPGSVLLGAGFALMLLGLVAIRRGADRLVAGATLAMVGAAAVGFGVGGAGGTAAGLLHLVLGCLALGAAGAGGWAGVLGAASLAGVPPLGVFASAYGLLAASMAGSALVTVVFAGLEIALVTLALRHLRSPQGRSLRSGWVWLVLTLGAGWALPPVASGWLLGIAAAAQ